jgi:protein TonB
MAYDSPIPAASFLSPPLTPSTLPNELAFARASGFKRRSGWGAPAMVIALHLALGYVLWHAAPVRNAVQEAAPLLVRLVQPTAQPQLAPEPPKPVAPKMVAVKPIVPEIEPVSIAVPAAPEPPAPVVVQAPAAPAPAVAPPPPEPVAASVEPKMISDVQYVQAPQPVYPAFSQRKREAGKVVVRVWIDPRGRAERAVVAQSSGFKRLDQAALEAVLAAIFKPYSENGHASYASALVPVNFELPS